MQDRILKFLKDKNLSSSKFASVIGVQPSGVSHILSGRNKPGFDFIIKILSRYPELNADWLLLGKGKMYKEMRQSSIFDNIPDNKVKYSHQEAEKAKNIDERLATKDETPGSPVQDAPTETHRPKEVERVIIFYTDKSFDEYLNKP